MCCTLLTIVLSVGMLVSLSLESIYFFKSISWNEFLFVKNLIGFSPKHLFGIFPLMSSTLLISVIALLISLPIGLTIAIYLSEYASKEFVRKARYLLEMLSSIPAVVFGFFALLFVSPLLQKFIPGLEPMNALSAGIVMGIMSIPYFTSLCEQAMNEVPAHFRHGSLALGGNQLQTAILIVIPAARPALNFAFIMAFSKTLGETLIVAIAAGHKHSTDLNPLHPVETLSTYIVNISAGHFSANSQEYKTIFVIGFILFLFTFSLNSIAYWLKKKTTVEKGHSLDFQINRD